MVLILPASCWLAYCSTFCRVTGDNLLNMGFAILYYKALVNRLGCNPFLFYEVHEI